jgi:hypothetical protein
MAAAFLDNRLAAPEQVQPMWEKRQIVHNMALQALDLRLNLE